MKEMPIEDALAMVPRLIVLEPGTYERGPNDFPVMTIDENGKEAACMLRRIPEDERRGVAKMIQFLSGQKSIDLISPDLYFPRWLYRNAKKKAG